MNTQYSIYAAQPLETAERALAAAGLSAVADFDADLNDLFSASSY